MNTNLNPQIDKTEDYFAPLNDEITDYQDFSNAPDGDDYYVAPVFGDGQVNDYNEEFAADRASREKAEAIKLNRRVHTDMVRDLLSGFTIGFVAITLFKIGASVAEGAYNTITTMI